MGISKNVFLRGGVGSTLYFNQEKNYAEGSSFNKGLIDGDDRINVTHRDD